jgi:DNA polymerase-3 subunit beta
MRGSVLQEDLNKSLGWVVRIVSTRGQLSILANVLLEADTDGLTVSATNLELGIRVNVGGKITVNGAITVPARNLAEFVGTLPTEPVNLEKEGEKLKIGTGKFWGVFAGIAAAEFPVLPKLGVKGKMKMSVKKEMIEEIAKQLVFAAATDESRPVLTGIQFLVEGDKLMVTATDGFRLSRKSFKRELGGNDQGWGEGLILPARAIAELSRITAEGKKENIEMEIVGGNSQVIFGYDRVQLVSRVLEGNFPDVVKIIPTEHKTEVIVDKEELIAAIRAAAIFARDSSNIVRFVIGRAGLIVKAASQQTGESESRIEAEIIGDEGEIAFNYRYVLEFLGSIDEERVKFWMSGNLAPGVWRGEKDENLTHLIMPVRL